MTQKVLPYKYEVKEEGIGITGLEELPTYLDLSAASGLMKSIERNLKIRRGEQGWTDRQMVMSMVMLNLAGGDCVDDIEKLQGDEGFCRIVRKAETSGLKGKAKALMKKRRRKGRKRTFPSVLSIFRYLSKFHNEGAEQKREEGKAYIPVRNKHIKACPDQQRVDRVRNEKGGRSDSDAFPIGGFW